MVQVIIILFFQEIWKVKIKEIEISRNAIRISIRFLYTAIVKYLNLLNVNLLSYITISILFYDMSVNFLHCIIFQQFVYRINRI